MCDCIKQFNEALRPHGMQIAQAIQLTPEPRLRARTVIATEMIDGHRRSKNTPTIVASHCPFCGEKVAVPEGQKAAEVLP